MLVESSFLFNVIYILPKSVILSMICVFFRLASSSSCFLTIRDCLAFSTLRIAWRSSSLNFSLVSRTYLVGYKASKTFKSIKSPNFNMCFSSYFLFNSSNIAFYSAIFLDSFISWYLNFPLSLVIFFYSCSSSFILRQRRLNSVYVKSTDFSKFSGS